MPLAAQYKRTNKQPEYGDITRISRSCGVSRETVREYMKGFPRFPKLANKKISILISFLLEYGFICLICEDENIY